MLCLIGFFRKTQNVNSLPYNLFKFSKKNSKKFAFTQIQNQVYVLVKFHQSKKVVNLLHSYQTYHNTRVYFVATTKCLCPSFSQFKNGFLIFSNYKSFRFFVNTTKVQRNFLLDFFLKTYVAHKKERREFGEREVISISKKFTIILASRIPNFERQWNFPMEDKVAAFILFPTLYDIKQIIVYYPTAFLYLTKTLRISDLRFEDFNLDSNFNRIEPKKKILLVDTFKVADLNFVFDHLDIIQGYYKKFFYAWTLTDCHSINFSVLGLKSAYFGTDMFFNTFEHSLRCALTTIKNKETTKFIWCVHQHVQTRPFFLTLPLNFNVETNIFNIGLNYSNLPLELAVYLTADDHIAISYKEDFFDILEQFFNLNYIKLRDMDNIQVFIKNKEKRLTQWSKEYNVPKEFILYCLEQYLRGKDSATFQPLKELLAIERKYDSDGPLISDTLIGFKYDLFDMIFSFFYRQSTLFHVLNYGNINSDYENQQKKSAIYPSGLTFPFNFDFIAMRDSDVGLNQINVKNLTAEDKLKLKKIGYPTEERQPFWNFDIIMHIVEKQIQQAFFDSLLEVLPTLRHDGINQTQNTYFTLSYLSRENRYFFLPRNKVNQDLNQILTLLHEKVANKTCYRLSFTSIDLIKEKNTLKTNILKLKKNILDNLVKILKSEIINKENFDFRLFTKYFLGDIPNISLANRENILSNNVLKTFFFEINLEAYTKNGSKIKTDYFFSYLEIEYVLGKVYPDAPPEEIAKKRKEICAELKKLGFCIDRRRIPLFKIPDNFRTKILNAGAYVQNNTVFSSGFCGIHFRYSSF